VLLLRVQHILELTALRGKFAVEDCKAQERCELLTDVVRALTDAVDAKDSYSTGHSGRVAAYAREIARRAGYSEAAQEEIYLMGLLHDVGKIGVPETIINKPAKLSDEEFEVIRNHPVMGARILRSIRQNPKLAAGARWHHERYNGKGYPDGLSGEEIPKEARILAVADAYDAMTSSRSFRSPKTQAEARREIADGRGVQFDPKFADIMLNMMDEDPDFTMREY
jgi:putative two-component system response regulator